MFQLEGDEEARLEQRSTRGRGRCRSRRWSARQILIRSGFNVALRTCLCLFLPFFVSKPNGLIFKILAILCVCACKERALKWQVRARVCFPFAVSAARPPSGRQPASHGARSPPAPPSRDTALCASGKSAAESRHPCIIQQLPGAAGALWRSMSRVPRSPHLTGASQGSQGRERLTP